MRSAAINYNDGNNMPTSPCKNKAAVLKYMRSFQPTAFAAGYFYDAKTGEQIKPLVSFNDGDWCWRNSDIYHVEKYDLALEPDFIEHVLRS